jgi:hypothetical protein
VQTAESCGVTSTTRRRLFVRARVSEHTGRGVAGASELHYVETLAAQP